MLSEQEWVKLLPKIRETLEKSKGPIARWAHRPLWGFVLQLVAELAEARDLLSRQGWVHQRDVLESIESATHSAYSAASDVERAADELRSAAEELLDPESRANPQILRHGPALDELMRLLSKRHLWSDHQGAMRFCNDRICEEAAKFQ